MQRSPTSNINPYLTNGFSHHYQLGESTFICRRVRSDFFLSNFSMKFLQANIIAASHLELWCLPVSHKRDARLKSVNTRLLGRLMSCAASITYPDISLLIHVNAFCCYCFVLLNFIRIRLP